MMRGSSMRVRKIKLKNGYKRFKELTIDLGEDPKRIVALVGRNGCGKSSVFDGMLFLQNTYSKIGTGPNKDFNYHSKDSNPAYDYQNIEIQFSKGSFQDVFRQKKESGTSSTIFSFRSP